MILIQESHLVFDNTMIIIMAAIYFTKMSELPVSTNLPKHKIFPYILLRRCCYLKIPNIGLPTLIVKKTRNNTLIHTS